MLEVDCCLHFESGQARLSLGLRFGAQGRRAAEPQPDRMVDTRAHPSTSSPCPAELPETRGSKRKLASPQGREGQGQIVAQSELGTLARQPSAAELRAAEAARSRLYGARPEDASQAAEERLPDGVAPAPTDFDSPPSSALEPYSNAGDAVQDCLAEATSKDWHEACCGLLGLRRLMVHHPALLQSQLSAAASCMLAGVKSLRSALTKTAIMAVADAIEAYRGEALALFAGPASAQPAGSMLGQLLLKAASNDKRFVVEEAQRALSLLSTETPPVECLTHMLPYTEHKNPKVRGMAGPCCAKALSRLDGDDWVQLSLSSLLKAAGRLLSDNMPLAREAARQMLPQVQAAYFASSKAQLQSSPGSGGQDAPMWPSPKANMSPLSRHRSTEPAGLSAKGQAVHRRFPSGASIKAHHGKENQDVEQSSTVPAPQSSWEDFCTQTLGRSSSAAVARVCS